MAENDFYGADYEDLRHAINSRFLIDHAMDSSKLVNSLRGALSEDSVQQISNPGGVLAPAAIGIFAGGAYLGDKFGGVAQPIGDLFDRSPPRMTGGPMSRKGYRHHSGVPVPLDEYPSSHANPHLLSSDFLTQQAYDDAVAEGHLANKEYNIMRSGMDYPVDNRSDWQKWKDSIKPRRR